VNSLKHKGQNKKIKTLGTKLHFSKSYDCKNEKLIDSLYFYVWSLFFILLIDKIKFYFIKSNINLILEFLLILQTRCSM
jgi:hypothetical protein